MLVMRIVVVGCGRVGSELATILSREGNEVSVVDKSRLALQRLAMDWEGKAVVGFGFDRDALEEAGISEADALAAVTNGDNSNILTARIAKETYQVRNVVARIYDPRRAVIYRRLGIPTVATVTWTVDQVVRRLLPDRQVTEWSAPGGEVILVERTLPAGWVGFRLEELESPGKCRLVALSRAGRALMAKPGALGQEGDLLYLCVATEAVEELEERLAKGPLR
ncbi:MAG TPA: TrkA family potassium uptake protein [Acidimicrobiales bacterium]|nr:TrkA family potassium uptake protein [Acidimicrobiales bacterium]